MRRVSMHVIVVFAVGLTLLWAPSPSQAGMVYSTGNQQYTNVNFVASDPTAYTITGYVGQISNNVPIYFEGYDATSTQIELHASHGVASVSPANATDSLYTLTLTMGGPYVMTAADWKLDAAGSNDGNVTFKAYDFSGNLIPLSSGTDTFAISHNGQNPYQMTTDSGSMVRELVITSTVPLADIKQVSVQFGTVPEPSTLLMVATGTLLGLTYTWRRRNRVPC